MDFMNKLKTIKVFKETHKELVLLKIEFNYNSIADILAEKEVVKALKEIRRRKT
jgi:hypothetical protein